MKEPTKQGKRARPGAFEGFSPALFGFLWELSENNSRDWFEAHRHVYTAQVLRPVKALVGEIGRILGTLSQDMEVEPRVGRTVSRINNDMRFQKNRPPYRPYIYLGFPRRGAKWSSGSLLCVGIFPHGVSVGFYSGEHDRRPWLPIQETIRRNPRAFQKYLDQRRIPERYFELAGKEGQATKWPLPKTARRWSALETFTVGEHFDSTDPILNRRAFVDKARDILLDLYPLWLFSQSADLDRDLNHYNESVQFLARRFPIAAD